MTLPPYPTGWYAFGLSSEMAPGAVGAGSGRAAYLLAGKLYLVRLTAGATTELAEATHARLTAAGLFYSYVGAAPWPGRIRFVPLAALP